MGLVVLLVAVLETAMLRVLRPERLSYYNEMREELVHQHAVVLNQQIVSRILHPYVIRRIHKDSRFYVLNGQLQICLLVIEDNRLNGFHCVHWLHISEREVHAALDVRHRSHPVQHNWSELSPQIV